jgi:patatin-like phospholipase/acyl hydrolase
MKNIFDPSLISRLKRTFGLWRTKYSVTYFNRWLHNQFRSLLLKNTLIPTGVTTYNVTRREAVLLNSTHSSHPLYHNIPIQAAARATTAAPLYFDPYEWQDNYLVDGGIYANNPSHWGLQYAQNLFPQKESYTIVSLGTGLYHHAPYQGGGLLQGGSKVVHHLLDLPQQLVGLHLSQQKPSIIYHRLQPHLSEQVDLDDTTRNEALKEAAESAIKSPVFETILKALQKKKEEKAMG